VINLPFSLAAKELFRRSRYAVVEAAIDPKTCARWRATALQLAEHYAQQIERRSNGHLLRYQVVTGEVLRGHWQELFDFYNAAETRAWVQLVTGADEVFASLHLRSAININVMSDPGEVYRWHFDAVPYTALLYLTTSAPEDGGALEFYPDVGSSSGQPDLRDREKISLLPRAGTMVLMDGTRCYHHVAPILRSHTRLCIPMVFPAIAAHERPSDLDSYLYADQTS
jgi:hypothetical protein